MNNLEMGKWGVVMNNEEIITIMKMFKEMKLSRFHYEKDDQKILIERNLTQSLLKDNKEKAMENIIEIKSPTVGQINVENQISIGSKVVKNQKIFTIETMKVMHDILSPCDGTVDFVVGNSCFVEYDQVIMRIKIDE